MTRLPSSILTIAALFGLLAGCAGVAGSGRSASTPVTRERDARDESIEIARRTFEQAKAAGGERAAPFDYHLAEEYLRLAVDEAREGDMIGVVGFAERSTAHSVEAIHAAGEEGK